LPENETREFFQQIMAPAAPIPPLERSPQTISERPIHHEPR
jgi:hypothetical protein